MVDKSESIQEKKPVLIIKGKNREDSEKRALEKLIEAGEEIYKTRVYFGYEEGERFHLMISYVGVTLGGKCVFNTIIQREDLEKFDFKIHKIDAYVSAFFASEERYKMELDEYIRIYPPSRESGYKFDFEEVDSQVSAATIQTNKESITEVKAKIALNLASFKKITVDWINEKVDAVLGNLPDVAKKLQSSSTMECYNLADIISDDVILLLNENQIVPNFVIKDAIFRWYMNDHSLNMVSEMMSEMLMNSFSGELEEDESLLLTEERTEDPLSSNKFKT